MLKAAAPCIRAADPNAEIVSAGVPNSYLSGAVPMTAYLEGMYAAGAQGAFDTLGLHIYCETPACSIGLVESARSTMNARRRRRADLGDRNGPGERERGVPVRDRPRGPGNQHWRAHATSCAHRGARRARARAVHVARPKPQTNSTDSHWNRVGLTYVDQPQARMVPTGAPRRHAPPETSIDLGPSGSGNGPSASFEFVPPRRAPTSPAAWTAAPRSPAPRRGPTPASRTALARSRPRPPTPTGTPI